MKDGLRVDLDEVTRDLEIAMEAVRRIRRKLDWSEHRKFAPELDDLIERFDASCENRTCHYRHSLLRDGLELARMMAGQLFERESADLAEIHVLVGGLAWGLLAMFDDMGVRHDGLLTSLREILHATAFLREKARSYGADGMEKQKDAGGDCAS